MNAAGGLALFLLGAFALVVFGVLNPSIEFYTGGIFIALLMSGLFFAFANTIRQTKKLAAEQKEAEKQAKPASPT
jgi:hypothetical protein